MSQAVQQQEGHTNQQHSTGTGVQPDQDTPSAQQSFLRYDASLLLFVKRSLGQGLF